MISPQKVGSLRSAPKVEGRTEPKVGGSTRGSGELGHGLAIRSNTCHRIKCSDAEY